MRISDWSSDVCSSDLLIGFQTESDVQRFRDYVLREAGGSADGDRLSAYGRTVVAKAFPIGIDAEQFAEMAASDEARKDAARLKAAILDRKSTRLNSSH